MSSACPHTRSLTSLMSIFCPWLPEQGVPVYLSLFLLFLTLIFGSRWNN
jgi:hypothetical protein